MLVGGEGDNTLNGNAGNDVIYGGGGHDMVDGGPGFDTLILAASFMGGDTTSRRSGYEAITNGKVTVYHRHIELFEFAR